jgi:hypothetical protein
VLTGEQVTSATGIAITKVRRAPSLAKIVQAGTSGGDPGPGKYICVYATPLDERDITIIIPPPDQQSTAYYMDARQSYFRDFPGSGRTIANLGEDAWLAGGSTLYVLARQDMHFVVTARLAPEWPDGLLIAVAQAVLARL